MGDESASSPEAILVNLRFSKSQGWRSIKTLTPMPSHKPQHHLIEDLRRLPIDRMAALRRDHQFAQGQALRVEAHEGGCIHRSASPVISRVRTCSFARHHLF